MLAELLGKAGKLCHHATEGTIRCPLMIRPTSEDVITGQIMQSLRIINPRWWLPQLLQRAIPEQRFRQQVYRRLQIRLWENRPSLPSEYLPYPEGSTQVDAVLRWENPATTVYLEFKYLSPLSTSTSNGLKQDQLLRNIRVGLQECGYYETPQLFPLRTRRFYQLVISPERGQPLVQDYRQPSRLAERLHETRVKPQLPVEPFVGELDYRDLVQILDGNSCYMQRAERLLAAELTNYLAFKRRQGTEIRQERQQQLVKNNQKNAPTELVH
jgi:hypothetical protein